MIVASTLDGYIAQEKNQNSTIWTSQEDKQWFAKISKKIGFLIMGRETFATIGRPLPDRKIIVYTRDHTAVRQAEELSQFTKNSEGSLFTSGEMSLPTLMTFLAEKGLKEIAICGGARVYQQALQENLVDEIYLTLEPVMFGGGVKLFAEKQLIKPYYFQVKERLTLSAQTQVWHLLPSAP